MRKILNDCFGKMPTITTTSSDIEPVKFSNDLVIQIESDENKHSNKKHNKFKIFFLVFVKAKIQAFSKSFCECFFFCKFSRKTDEEDSALKPISCGYSPEKTTSVRVGLNDQSNSRQKKTLILDLDETLVHSYFVPTKCDLFLEIPYQEKMLAFYINIRAGVEHFLDVMNEHYEVIIYTASMSEYADKVVDYLDKKKLVSQRLFRENCTFYKRGFVKDLSKIGRDLKDVILIDNSPLSFAFQPENGIQIKSYFDDPNDRELYNLIPFLIFLSKTNDVRPINIWKEKFYSSCASFPYLDMNNKRQTYDKAKERKSHENNENNRLSNLKHKLQLDIKESKRRAKSLGINYAEVESAEKMKKNDYEELDAEVDTFNEALDGKSTDFEEKVKEKSDFDDQRYNLDSSNINSPIIKKEIVFQSENDKHEV